jgi:hypothetical protein
MSEETITFEVISTSSNEIQTIINFMTDLFRRYDTSAKEINLQLISTSPFIFYFFRLQSSDPIQSFQNEGGFMSGIISIDYCYSRELDGLTGRFA